MTDKPLTVLGWHTAGERNEFLFANLCTSLDVIEVRPRRAGVLVGQVADGVFMCCLIFHPDEPFPDFHMALTAVDAAETRHRFDPCTIDPLKPGFIFGKRI